MKKYFVLTSALALAACTGGNGGGGDNNVFLDTLTPAQRAAVESNRNLTGMLTYIETDDSGNTTNSRYAITRNSGTQQMGGSHDLSDVNFVTADEDFDTVDGFTFVVDENKKVIGIDMQMTDIEDYPEDGPEYFERGNEDDSNEFTGLVKTEDWVKGRLDYNSLGKDMGLRYSDFGNIKINIYNEETSQFQEAQTLAFIGGYDNVKKIDTDDIAETTEFSGRATGGVVSILGGEGSGQTLDLDTSANTEGSTVARLVFDKQNETSTLVAEFDNWYDVRYTKSGNTTGTVEFTNGKNEDFYLLGDTDGSGKTVNVSGEDLHYFGDNNNPSEAVGLVQVRDCNGAGCGSDYNEHQEVRMNLGFGAKKD